MINDINLGKLFRHIQKLSISQKPEDEEELDFYLTVFKCFINELNPKVSYPLLDISFKKCPLDKAQALAIPLGLHIAEGGTANYLSFSKSILEED